MRGLPSPRAIAAGDDVHAAVRMCREASWPQISEAAKVIGIEQVTYIDGSIGEVTPTAKAPIVRLLREFRPDVVIMQDPEHARHARSTTVPSPTASLTRRPAPPTE